mmetsp:Transcript_18367/g.55307  ORF Transcript_18367/g.55307 Transcript_18367/m.55307 type:complete len:538 (+) Transcript_18367:4300-5913(+)
MPVRARRHDQGAGRCHEAARFRHGEPPPRHPPQHHSPPPAFPSAGLPGVAPWPAAAPGRPLRRRRGRPPAPPRPLHPPPPAAARTPALLSRSWPRQQPPAPPPHCAVPAPAQLPAHQHAAGPPALLAAAPAAADERSQRPQRRRRLRRRHSRLPARRWSGGPARCRRLPGRASAPLELPPPRRRPQQRPSWPPPALRQLLCEPVLPPPLPQPAAGRLFQQPPQPTAGAALPTLLQPQRSQPSLQQRLAPARRPQPDSAPHDLPRRPQRQPPRRRSAPALCRPAVVAGLQIPVARLQFPAQHPRPVGAAAEAPTPPPPPRPGLPSTHSGCRMTAGGRRRPLRRLHRHRRAPPAAPHGLPSAAAPAPPHPGRPPPCRLPSTGGKWLPTGPTAGRQCGPAASPPVFLVPAAPHAPLLLPPGPAPVPAPDQRPHCPIQRLFPPAAQAAASDQHQTEKPFRRLMPVCRRLPPDYPATAASGLPACPPFPRNGAAAALILLVPPALHPPARKEPLPAGVPGQRPAPPSPVSPCRSSCPAAQRL